MTSEAIKWLCAQNAQPFHPAWEVPFAFSYYRAESLSPEAYQDLADILEEHLREIPEGRYLLIDGTNYVSEGAPFYEWVDEQMLNGEERWLSSEQLAKLCISLGILV